MPANQRAKITYAAWLYRTDRFEEAASLLNELTKTIEDDISKDGYASFFAAMAHHRLGNIEEAHKWADMANDWRAITSTQPVRSFRRWWGERLLSKVLTKEMQRVLSNKPDQADGSKPDNNQPVSAPKPEVGKQKSADRDQKEE